MREAAAPGGTDRVVNFPLGPDSTVIVTDNCTHDLTLHLVNALTAPAM